MLFSSFFFFFSLTEYSVYIYASFLFRQHGYVKKEKRCSAKKKFCHFGSGSVFGKKKKKKKKRERETKASALTLFSLDRYKEKFQK